MMTLDEAIEYAEWAANNCDGECAEEHRQLAEWLCELRRAGKVIDLLKILRDGFKADAQKYKAESVGLRELVKSAWGCVNRHVSCDACRMTFGGCMLQSAMRELGIEVD